MASMVATQPCKFRSLSSFGISDVVPHFHPLRKRGLQLICIDQCHHSGQIVVTVYTINKITVLAQKIQL